MAVVAWSAGATLERLKQELRFPLDSNGASLDDAQDDMLRSQILAAAAVIDAYADEAPMEAKLMAMVLVVRDLYDGVSASETRPGSTMNHFRSSGARAMLRDWHSPGSRVIGD